MSDHRSARAPATEVIEIAVKRYVCPWCRRGRSVRRAAEAHAARCWRNPTTRGCKTCRNLEVDEDVGEFCAEAVDLRDGLVSDCEFWAAPDVP